MRRGGRDEERGLREGTAMVGGEGDDEDVFGGGGLVVAVFIIIGVSGIGVSVGGRFDNLNCCCYCI